MRKGFMFLGVVLAGLCAGTGYGADASVSADLNQGYVWRGMTFNDGLVLQPSVAVSTEGGFGINVWGNMDIGDYGGTMQEGEFSETDITLSYSLTAGGCEMSVGMIEYLYAHQSTEDMGALPGTREVYLSLSREIAKGVSAGVNVYYDFDEVDDYYANLFLGYSASLSDKIGLECSGSVGSIGRDMSLGGKGGLNDYSVSTTISFAASEAMSISGTLGYTGSMDKDVLPEQDVDLFGGVNISLKL